MATRVEQALKNIRASLSDLDGERWSDDQLIIFLDKAQKELVKTSGALKNVYALDTVNGEYFYTLPNTVLRINRVEYKRSPLTFIPLDKAPRVGLDNGTPEYVILDKLRRNQIMLYPTPNNEEDNNANLNVFVTEMAPTISTIDDDFVISPLFDDALEFYACYLALIANQDTVSMQLAGEYKQNYLIQLNNLLRDTSVNFKSTGRTSYYKGFV